jgi:hypothetical protein
MKNVKILRALIGLFVASNALTVLYNLVSLLILWPAIEHYVYLTFIIILINLIKGLLVLPTLILLFQAVHYFIKRGYFNNKSAIKLKLAGILLIVCSVVEYFTARIIGIYSVNNMEIKHKFTTKWLDGLPVLSIFLLIGFGLYTLSDFIRKGEAITRENELTI